MKFFKTRVPVSKSTHEFNICKAKPSDKLEDCYGKSVAEGFKGTITKKFNSLLQKKFDAEPHPFNYDDVKAISKQYGPVSGAINKYINYTVSAGMYTKSKNPKALQIINDFMDDVNLKYHTKRWLKQGLRKGFSPMELGMDKDAQGNMIITAIKILNADTVFKQRDDYGNITGYIQLKTSDVGSTSSMSFNKDNIIPFNPTEILSLDINQSEDEAYGLGMIYPNLHIIKNLLNAETEMHMLLERKANSPIHVKMGDREHEISPSSTDISKMKNSLTDLRNDQEWVTDDMVEMKVLEFGNIGSKFENILLHDLKQLSTGIEVPQVLLGYGNIPEGLADKQQDDFERTISNIKDEIKRLFENTLFKLVLKANGMEEKVEVIFGSPSLPEKNNRIVQLTNLLSNQMLSPDLRVEIEIQLAALLEIDKEKLIDPEKKKKALMDQQQAPVPGQNEHLGETAHNNYMTDESDYYKDYSIKIHEKYLEEHPDITVKEWVGFNYKSYINKIYAAIDAYEFPELLGTSPEAISNGKFSTVQVDDLRVVLKNGFEEGKTIREITTDIVETVQPNDLTGVNKNGNIYKIPAHIRAPMIARTECTRMAAHGSVLNYKDNGVKEVRYLAVIDERTSEICQSLDGQIFGLKYAMSIIPAHPYCRSVWVPITKLS